MWAYYKYFQYSFFLFCTQGFYLNGLTEFFSTESQPEKDYSEGGSIYTELN